MYVLPLDWDGTKYRGWVKLSSGLSRLWTKVQEILRQCMEIIRAFQRPCPIVYNSTSSFVQQIFAI